MSNVKIISYSKAPDNIELDNVEDLIAFCARVSNPSNQMNKETNSKLIKYLIKHKHWSPLEMVSACLEIHTTRDIAHQIVRHRSFAFQEFSQRYAPVTTAPVVQDLRLQDHSNRQNSIDSMNEYDKQVFQLQLQQHYEQSHWLYNQMLDAGVAKECARDILPLATKTTIHITGTLRDLLGFLNVRCDNHAQKEIRLIANLVGENLAKELPNVFKEIDWKNGMFM